MHYTQAKKWETTPNWDYTPHLEIFLLRAELRSYPVDFNPGGPLVVGHQLALLFEVRLVNMAGACREQIQRTVHIKGLPFLLENQDPSWKGLHIPFRYSRSLSFSVGAKQKASIKCSSVRNAEVLLQVPTLSHLETHMTWLWERTHPHGNLIICGGVPAFQPECVLCKILSCDKWDLGPHAAFMVIRVLSNMLKEYGFHTGK